MPRFHSRRTTAFTIVELLVVISIIGVLVSMLLPSLQQAREVGNRTVCAANQRQALIAMSVYKQDQKNFPYWFFNSNYGYTTTVQGYVDGYTTGTTWFASGRWNANGTSGLFQVLFNGGYAVSARGVACTTTGNKQTLITGAYMTGFEYLPSLSPDYTTPDGLDAQQVGFFAYNGPGADMNVSWNRANPLCFVDKNYNTVSSVREEYGYYNDVAGSQVFGQFKLIDCPTVVQHTSPGPVGNHFSPHDNNIYLGSVWGPPTKMHFRNYGYVDGHVLGFESVLGFQ